MLRFLQYSNPRQLRPLFEKLNPFQDTLVISHLRTKLELQEILLQKNNFVVDESLLRISEFSEQLFRRNFPEFRILQPDVAEIRIKSFLRSNFSKLQVDPELAPSFLEFIEFFGNFLCIQENRKILNDWFTAHPDSEARWKKWYLVGGLLCDMLMSQHRVLRSWVPSLLVNSLPLEKKIFWSRKIWVDLRTDITWGEAELFSRLAKLTDVYIFAPDYPALPQNARARKIYEYLMGFAEKDNSMFETVGLNNTPSGSMQCQTLKVSGGLAEVRTTVSQVRRWLEEGISPEQIAIVTPKVEEYWPIFEAYLRKEGIPVSKKITVRYSGLPAVQKWISKHHIVGKSLSSSHLETAIFDYNDRGPIDFSEFMKLYSRIYESTHLHRHERVAQILNQMPRLEEFKDQNLTRDEFVGLSLTLWESTEETEPLVQILKEYVNSIEESESLNFSDHLQLLEKVVSRKERTIAEEMGGIVYTGISSGHILDVTHKIYLGLLQENFQVKMPPFVSARDILALQTDLGFHLENPEEEKVSQELILQRQEDRFLQKTLWICPATHLGGEVGTPHPIWIEINQKVGEAKDLSMVTVWDSWQRQWNRQEVQSKTHQTIPIEKQISLSPSSVRDFLECPFIYIARKVYGLEDPDWIDIEVPASEWGKLQHFILEKILRQDLDSWDDKKLNALIEQTFTEHPMIVSDELLLKPMAEKLLKLAVRFIEIEKKWRQQNSKLLKQEFETFWEKKVQGSAGAEVTFRGVIDRIDYFDSGHLIFDYKTSRSQVSNFGSWMDKDQLQLLFYDWGLDEKAFGTLFYVLRDLKRDKGFLLKDAPASPEEISSRALIDHNQLQELRQAFQEKINLLVETLETNKFEIKPKDRKSCTDCSWRKTCRATHLVKI